MIFYYENHAYGLLYLNREMKNQMKQLYLKGLNCDLIYKNLDAL
jgi:hypothetical protein